MRDAVSVIMNRYFLIGASLALFSIAVQNESISPALRVAITGDKYEFLYRTLQVLMEFFRALGIALMLAAAFSWVATTDAFLKRITDMLKETVIDQSFLNTLEEEKRRRALDALMTPKVTTSGEDDRDLHYVNSKSYREKLADRIAEYPHKNIRTQYSVDVSARFDSDKCRIVGEYVINYRLFRSRAGYEKILMVCRSADADCDVIEQKVQIRGPSGEQVELSWSDGDQFLKCTPTQEELGIPDLEIPVKESEDRTVSYEIPICALKMDAHPYLDIQIRAGLEGQDHWQLFAFGASQPTDGFRMIVRCDAPVTVRESVSFFHKEKLHQFPTDESGVDRLEIASSQWMEPGQGAAVLVSAPHQYVTKKKKKKDI